MKPHGTRHELQPGVNRLAPVRVLLPPAAAMFRPGKDAA